eukprot:CAMPEP_0113937672 /NCGR_PEP_ID=MMETSP1339-20121228/4241_1 /TAXON_ID=94617 /ORGANISM="Fibrocapsa japonica" /LENGTH=287 /DNA_ID=CAMNT_0000940521 /DNA_START=8 /DNA_END=871 /DNA_ORIENTATION=+ /assembly_acc=CAM_ASM_000762
MADELLNEALCGDLVRVKHLLEAGTSCNVRNEEGRTALHECCVNGHEQMARFLIEFGSEIDAEDAYQQTPLNLAAEKGHTAILALLCHEGAIASHQDSFGRSALHWCARNAAGVREMAAAIQENAAKNSAAAAAAGASSLSSSSSSSPMAPLVVLETGAGETPLHWAVAGTPWSPERESVVQMLLSWGSDPRRESKSSGQTPLQATATPQARQLLEEWIAKARAEEEDIEAKDEERRQQLMKEKQEQKLKANGRNSSSKSRNSGAFSRIKQGPSGKKAPKLTIKLNK